MKSRPSGGNLLRVSLVFDGGSKGNPGPTYGSVLIKSRGLPKQPIKRLTWGKGTNNEAEYRALIGGVRELLKCLASNGIDPEAVDLRIAGDSSLVLNQLAGTWKIKSPRMRNLRDEAAPLIERFGVVRYVHHDRKHSVRLLGH
jgi:ribonuclease HI